VNTTPTPTQSRPAAAVSLFDLHRPEVIADPWPTYRTLLARPEPCWDATGKAWLVSRHADVAALLGDPRCAVGMDHTLAAAYAPAPMRPLYPLLDAHVSFLDPPDHPRVRRELAGLFTPRHAEALTGYIADAVTATLDRYAAAGGMDVVADLAAAIPLLVVRDLLGLDEVDLPRLRRWSNAWGDVVAAPGHLPTGDTEQLVADVTDLFDTLRAAVAAHRGDQSAQRSGTLTGRLVAAAADGRLRDDELVGNLAMLVTAGHETTANLIANAVAALLDQPALADRLRRHPDLLPAAVDELARVYSPTQYTARTARAELDVAGQPVAAGQNLVLVLAAANRDPAAFADADTVRLDRPANPRHVAFGHGPHFCFGAPLARLETRLVLAAVLTRCTDLRPAGARQWRLNGNLRGLATLPIAYTPAPARAIGEPEHGGTP